MKNPMHTSQQDWLDLKQVEREFPVSKRTIWTWISSGRLPAYKPFRKTLVKRADLDHLFESTRIGADLDAIVDETLRELGTK
jgi:excisionase family DNA binding protein